MKTQDTQWRMKMRKKEREIFGLSQMNILAYFFHKRLDPDPSSS